MSKSHDLFLLMLNLSQLNDKSQSIAIFTDAMNELWRSLDMTFFDRDNGKNTGQFPITTIRKKYGSISVGDQFNTLSREEQSLVHNAVQMLAVILEKQEQTKLLADEKVRLDDLVHE